MTPSTDPQAAQAYTRTSVERYLSAAAAEQSRLQVAIVEARQRTESALREEQRLLSLRDGDQESSRRGNGARPDTDPDPFRFTVDTAEHAWSDPGFPAAAAATDVGR
jgi:hypothetical protein